MSTAACKLVGGDYEHSGAASRSVKEMLKKVGADPAVVRRAMIAAYEAEMNVVIHAYRGELRATLQNGRLRVEVIDEGPGIADIQQALREGFSTASAKARELGFGAGMGLPNIRKSSDHFAIESTVGRGTRVTFTILLKPQALYGTGRHSLHIDADKCRQSLRCIHACPTRALGVFRGKPEVLDYLCIDCTACIAACPSGTLTAKGTGASLLPADDAILVLTPESLVQFGAGISPRLVLAELAALGFGDVRTTAVWETALRVAVTQHAAAEAQTTPVISPACPAVVNLIETRFPSLIPHVAPFLPAIAALQAELAGRRAVFVVCCPCQGTVLLAGDSATKPEVLLPAALRSTILPRLTSRTGEANVQPTGTRRHDDGREILRVTGLRHVMSVLEATEDGLAGDVRIVEPWACDQGCFGSPLLAEDAFLARLRWEAAALESEPQSSARAIRRTAPLAPRSGLRLDSDMSKAIQKLAKIDKLRRGLPGGDGGMCGAPTCAALAEDIVLGRAHPDACPRRRPGFTTPSGGGGPPATEPGA